MTTQNQVEAATSINYSFTAIPTILIYLLDNDCFKLISLLIQKETYWKNKNHLEDGYFIKSILELSEELNIKNKKDVRLVIEALYRADMIDVITIEQKRNTAKFKINWNKINELTNINLYDALEFNQKITKLSRNETITYCNKVVTDKGTDMGTEVGTNCTTTIDTINNINKKNNIYNNILNNNKEYIKEDIISFNDINKEVEEKKELVQVEEESITTVEDNEYIEYDITSFNSNLEESESKVTVQVVNNLNTDDLRDLNGVSDTTTSNERENVLNELETVNTEIVESRSITKFQSNLNKLFSRMEEAQTSEELDDKLVKLCEWVEKQCNKDSSIEKEQVKELIFQKYTSIKDSLAQAEKAFENIIIDNFNFKEEELPAVVQNVTKDKVEKDLKSLLQDLNDNGKSELSEASFNFYLDKYSKEITEYQLEDLVQSIQGILTASDDVLDENNTTTSTIAENAGNSLKIPSFEETINQQWKLSNGAVVNLKDMIVEEEEEYPF